MSFYVRALFIFFLFAGSIPAWAQSTSEAHGTNIYETPIECADLKAKIVSRCSMDKELTVSCFSQELLLPSGARDIRLKAADVNGVGFFEQWKMYSWGCVQKENRTYLLFSYANGGNCDSCEKFQLRSLKGVMVEEFKNYRQMCDVLDIPCYSNDQPNAFSKRMHVVHIGNGDK